MDRRMVDLYDKLYYRFTGEISDGECWRLCGGWCCEPDAELPTFVGEMEYRERRGLNDPRYLQVRDDELICKAHGRCPTRTKPLVCRLFPVMIERDDRSGALVVWRSRGCPLKSFSRDYVFRLLATINELSAAVAGGYNICRKTSYYTHGRHWAPLRLKPPPPSASRRPREQSPARPRVRPRGGGRRRSS
jgi:Fe-S-cluster containining protein